MGRGKAAILTLGDGGIVGAAVRGSRRDGFKLATPGLSPIERVWSALKVASEHCSPRKFPLFRTNFWFRDRDGRGGGGFFPRLR